MRAVCGGDPDDERRGGRDPRWHGSFSTEMKVAGGWSLLDLVALQRASGSAYLEFEREDSMSVGLYVLPAGATDGQSPHTEDEVYVVLEGHARFTAADEVRDAAPGDVIFVSAGVPHRFHDITEELRIVVVFAPPESTSTR